MVDQTGRESDKFMLRLPDGLRDQIKNVAEENKRSMNAEIVLAIEDYITTRELYQARGESDPIERERLLFEKEDTLLERMNELQLRLDRAWAVQNDAMAKEEKANSSKKK